jgi:hypothetical protein
MHRRFRRQHRDHGRHLGHRPDEQNLEHHPVRHPHQLDVGYRNLGVERRRHPPDADHLGDLRRLGHRLPLGVARQVGSDLGDPCPAKVRTGCCLGVLLGEECPCPGSKRMGCCPGEECRQLVKEGLGLAQRLLALQPQVRQLALRRQQALLRDQALVLLALQPLARRQRQLLPLPLAS